MLCKNNQLAAKAVIICNCCSMGIRQVIPVALGLCAGWHSVQLAAVTVRKCDGLPAARTRTLYCVHFESSQGSPPDGMVLLLGTSTTAILSGAATLLFTRLLRVGRLNCGLHDSTCQKGGNVQGWRLSYRMFAPRAGPPRAVVDTECKVTTGLSQQRRGWAYEGKMLVTGCMTLSPSCPQLHTGRLFSHDCGCRGAPSLR